MRRLLPVLTALLLTGCGKSIDGFWDIVEWEATRDGKSTVADDVGWVMFQDDTTVGFGLMLRYDYDPDALELVPTADPGQVRGGYNPTSYRYDKNEPEIGLRYEQDGFITTAEFDITRYTNGEMTLETATPNTDGSNWRWELVR